MVPLKIWRWEKQYCRFTQELHIVSCDKYSNNLHAFNGKLFCRIQENDIAALQTLNLAFDKTVR
jgi:hypothetical protein